MTACDSLRTSQDTLLFIYGSRCGGRSEAVASCEDKFAATEMPPPVPLTLVEAESPLAAACRDGDLLACDELGNSTDQNLEIYGESCGGRNGPTFDCPAMYARLVGSPDNGSAIVEQAAESLNELAFECQGSHLSACDALEIEASSLGFSGLAEYGATCGNRVTVETECAEHPLLTSFPPADDYRQLRDSTEDHLRALAESCASDNWTSCVRLAQQAGPGYESFREFAEACGGYEDPAERPVACLDTFAAVAPPQTLARPESTTVPEPGPEVEQSPSTPALSESQRAAIFGTLAEHLAEEPVRVEVLSGDLKIGETSRWSVSVSELTDASVPAAQDFAGEVRIQIGVRYNGPPGEYEVVVADLRAISARVEGNGVTVPGAQIAELEVTPSVSGPSAPSLEVTLADSSGTVLDRAQLAVSDLIIEDRTAIETIAHWLTDPRGYLTLAAVAIGLISRFTTAFDWIKRPIRSLIRKSDRRTTTLSPPHQGVTEDPDREQLRSMIVHLRDQEHFILADRSEPDVYMYVRQERVGRWYLEYREGTQVSPAYAYSDSLETTLNVIMDWQTREGDWAEALSWQSVPV